MQKFQKIVAVFALSLFALGSTQGMAQNRNASAVVTPPTSTHASPTNTRTFIVCANPCRDLSTARVYNTRVGAMPQGNFQITGLAQDQYRVGPQGFAPKLYSVSRNGVLNGLLGTHGPAPIGGNADVNPSSDWQRAYCSSKGCHRTMAACATDGTHNCWVAVI